MGEWRWGAGEAMALWGRSPVGVLTDCHFFYWLSDGCIHRIIRPYHQGPARQFPLFSGSSHTKCDLALQPNAAKRAHCTPPASPVRANASNITQPPQEGWVQVSPFARKFIKISRAYASRFSECD